MTTISISSEMWKKLNEMKQCGETFEDVLRRLIVPNQVKDNRAISKKAGK